MHKKLGLTAGLTAIVLTTLLSACGGSTSSSTSKTLNLVQASDPSTVDVNDVRNANEFNILNATQEGLFRITSNKGHDHLKLAQAKSYTISFLGGVILFPFSSYTANDKTGDAVPPLIVTVFPLNCLANPLPL